MSRITIGRHELVRIVNEQMRGMDLCRNLTVTIARDDSRCTGPNWRVTMIKRSGADHDEVACNDAIQTFLQGLADRFDVPERVASSDEITSWLKQIPTKGCKLHPMSEPVPAHVVDSLLDAQFIVLVGEQPERTASGDQVANS